MVIFGVGTLKPSIKFDHFLNFWKWTKSYFFPGSSKQNRKGVSLKMDTFGAPSDGCFQNEQKCLVRNRVPTFDPPKFQFFSKMTFFEKSGKTQKKWPKKLSQSEISLFQILVILVIFGIFENPDVREVHILEFWSCFFTFFMQKSVIFDHFFALFWVRGVWKTVKNVIFGHFGQNRVIWRLNFGYFQVLTFLTFWKSAQSALYVLPDFQFFLFCHFLSFLKKTSFLAFLTNFLITFCTLFLRNHRLLTRFMEPKVLRYGPKSGPKSGYFGHF